jgi:CRP-like cAMP-binding protein
VKVDQEEVFQVLNKDLEIKMRAILSGHILQKIKVFGNFKYDFLSDVAKNFKKRTFTVDDDILVEGDKGGTMYFIVTGLVTVLHKKTQTYIIDLK